MKLTTDRFFAPEHQQPQDWDKLAEYLETQGFQFNPAVVPRQFVGGFGNLNFLIEIDGKPQVLRRPPLGPLPPGANDMVREFRVTSRLWQKFPLAPKALLLCEDVKVLGAPFLIMQYRPGAVIHMELPPELHDRTWQLSKMIVEVLCKFQSVDPARVGLDDLGRPEGFLNRAVEGWIKRYSVAAQDVYTDRKPPESASDIIRWLRQQPVPDAGFTLLHNDFKLNNIVLDLEDPVTPIALLDWDMCTRGDPLFDFATLLSYWVEPNDPPALNKVGQMPTSTSTGWMNRKEVTDYYGAMSGQDLSDIHYYRVLTAFKHCIIFMQIYARFCRGTTTDLRIAELGPALDSLFEFTHDVMKHRYF
ncbi:MAG: phosphotransferase family protein [Acidiferrobacterales bacterium]|nr:phosphotransferase family protein [Acidiferrobacterales bacterium]